MRISYQVLLPALLAWLIFWGCGTSESNKPADEQPPTDTEENAGGPVETPAPDTKPKPEDDPNAPDYTAIYSGKLDEKYEIEMQLDYKEDVIEGSYFYTSQNKPLRLEGRRNEENGIIKLTEFDGFGKETGNWSGFLTPFGFHGEWVSGDESDTLGFEVTMVGQTFITDYASAPGGKVRVISRKLLMEDETHKCKYEESYPEFTGLANAQIQTKINEYFKGGTPEEIKKSLTGCGDEWGGFEETATYSVNFVGNGLASVAIDFFSYYEGAAHGNYGSESHNISLESGDHLDNASLFTDGYEETINALIISRIEKKYGEWGLDFQTVAPDQNYDLFRDRIETYFNPYDIGPYAAGQIRFSFSYQELKDIIRPDGPLAGFVE